MPFGLAVSDYIKIPIKYKRVIFMKKFFKKDFGGALVQVMIAGSLSLLLIGFLIKVYQRKLVRERILKIQDVKRYLADKNIPVRI